MQVNIYEAKTHLSALLTKAQNGEDIVIARSGRPLARLIPIGKSSESRSGVRFGGLDADSLKLTDDFHTPFTDDDLIGS